MPLDFFGSLGKKRTPRHDRGGALVLDLNESMPPSFTTPNKYSAPYNSSNTHGLKASKSWYAPRENRPGDGGRGPTHGPHPVIPADPAAHQRGRTPAPEVYHYERDFQDDVYNGDIYDDEGYEYDVELDKSYQAKMDSIERWRQKTSDAEERSQAWSRRRAEREEPERRPLQLHSPPRVERRGYAVPSGRPSGPRVAATSHPLDMPPVPQGSSSKRSIYPMMTSGTRSKSTPHLLDNPNDTLLLRPTQTRHAWCNNCRAFPPAGTKCVHGVSNNYLKKHRHA